MKPHFEENGTKLVGTNARKFTGTPPVMVLLFQKKLWNVCALSEIEAEVLAGN